MLIVTKHSTMFKFKKEKRFRYDDTIQFFKDFAGNVFFIEENYRDVLFYYMTDEHNSYREGPILEIAVEKFEEGVKNGIYTIGK